MENIGIILAIAIWGIANIWCIAFCFKKLTKFIVDVNEINMKCLVEEINKK